ncbi:methyltransferase domain-containing protein [Roseicella aerolata]|uniref:Class I SAM-dependent methyltransferase n=1 Tax=Roseicella aerolata TaxID=2883479 RepID=A0A9X1IC35_9PROT|nr:methyltransferase domain-containing protein [Roseicella aerolata]MCB4820998.1 class I SAM-dependent methyltransferase [Roseicella aerolata]
MHDTAHEHGRLFFELYWQPEFAVVAELGSYDVNGSLRDHAPRGIRYVGFDMEAGPGVDVVVAPGKPLPLPDGSVDVAVTSSAFEHDIAFWDTFLELIRILRPGGLLYVNAPSNHTVHRYPLDCWRFYPDASQALCEWAARRGIDVTLAESFIGKQGGEGWCDFVAVFRKSAPTPLRRRGRIADHVAAVNILDGSEGAPPRREAERAETDEMLEIAALRAALAERDAALAAGTARLAEQQAENAALTARLTAREQDVAAFTARLAARDGDLAALAARLATLEQALAAREGECAGLAARLAEREGEAAGLRAALAAREETVGRLQAEIAASATALEVAEGHLRNVLGSRSWRITAPLRAVITRMRH